MKFKVDVSTKILPLVMLPLNATELQRLVAEKIQAISKTLQRTYKGIKFFIEYRNSADCIRSRNVYHKLKLIQGTLQDNAITKSFMSDAFSAEQDLTYRRAA